MHTIVHQAFAWRQGRAHERVYGGRRCGCNARLRALLPPRDATGELLGMHGEGLDARIIAQQLRGLLLDDDALITLLWEQWYAVPDEPFRWVQRRALDEAAPAHIVAMVDRLPPPPPSPPPSPPAAPSLPAASSEQHLITLPAAMAPLSDEALHRLRQPSAASHRHGNHDNHDSHNATVPLVYPCGYAGAEEDWIPRVMLRGCQTRVHCLSEIARGVGRGDHAEGALAIAPGAVIVLQSQQMPLLRMLARLYKVPLRSLVLVHISDGNIWNERVAETARLYEEWGYAFRQYWLPDAPHDSLERAAARGDVEWFPIGMNPQWVQLLPDLASGQLPRPAASQRRHAISFLGSTDKSERRTRIEAVSRAVAPLGIRVHHKEGNVGCYGRGCANMDYVRETLDSALCLSLPGSSVESNRLYESLEAGCIPLVVRQFGPGEAAVGTAVETGPRAIELVKAALSPLELVTGHPPPFIVVDYEAELPAALGKLLSSPEALDAMQQRVISWWAAAKDHYAAAFQRAVCPEL